MPLPFGRSKRADSVDPDASVGTYIDETTIYSTQRAGAVLLALAGMALQWAALHTITFLGTTFGNCSAAVLDDTWIVNSLATFATFLAAFLMSRRRSSLLECAQTVPVAGFCLAAGVLSFVMASWVPLLMYVGNAIIAVGTTLLILMWGEVYRSLNPRGEQLLVILGAIVLSVVLYLVEIRLPYVLAVVVFGAMLAGSFACLQNARTLFERLDRLWGTRARVAAQKSPALLLVCIVVFSIPYNFLGGDDGIRSLVADIWEWSGVLSVTVVVMIAACLIECTAERAGIALMPVIALVLLSAAMVVHLFAGAAVPLLMSSLLYAGYYLFLAMVYLALGPIVATTDVNPLRLFSGAMLANVGGLLVGTLLGGLSLLVSERAAALLVMGVAYCILFAGFALWRDRSYSIFRVNSFDEERYSFEYLAPFPSDAASRVRTSGPGTAAFGGRSAGEAVEPMVEAISAQCEVAGQRYGLSARERQVLVELVRGHTIASIADRLVVSENTVKAHAKAIYRKLGVHTREELAACVERA